MNINVETALKTIVSTVVPEEEAPVGEHREEKIQALVTPLSFVSRMTVDVVYKMYINKILMELKFLTRDILKS